MNGTMPVTFMYSTITESVIESVLDDYAIPNNLRNCRCEICGVTQPIPTSKWGIQKLDIVPTTWIRKSRFTQSYFANRLRDAIHEIKKVGNHG